jgi:hypothetical protein
MIIKNRVQAEQFLHLRQQKQCDLIGSMALHNMVTSETPIILQICGTTFEVHFEWLAYSDGHVEVDLLSTHMP